MILITITKNNMTNMVTRIKNKSHNNDDIRYEKSALLQPCETFVLWSVLKKPRRFARRRQPVLNDEARAAVTEKYVEMRFGPLVLLGQMFTNIFETIDVSDIEGTVRD